ALAPLAGGRIGHAGELGADAPDLLVERPSRCASGMALPFLPFTARSVFFASATAVAGAQPLPACCAVCGARSGTGNLHNDDRMFYWGVGGRSARTMDRCRTTGSETTAGPDMASHGGAQPAFSGHERRVLAATCLASLGSFYTMAVAGI